MPLEPEKGKNSGVPWSLQGVGSPAHMSTLAPCDPFQTSDPELQETNARLLASR